MKSVREYRKEERRDEFLALYLRGVTATPIMNWMKEKNEANGEWKERIVRYATGISILFATYLVLMLLYVYPHWPIDLIGWSILILAGIPVFLCLEGVVVFTKERGQKISSNEFSIKRVITALIISLIILSLIASASCLLWVAYGSFIRTHFR